MRRKPKSTEGGRKKNFLKNIESISWKANERDKNKQWTNSVKVNEGDKITKNIWPILKKVNEDDKKTCKKL